MIDQVHGRELPPMEDWTAALLDEAIHCKVQFGVLVLGQGMVTAQMVRAMPGAKMAVMRVTYDPRNRIVGVEFPADMRYVSEIRHPANTFSLMKPANMEAHKVATMRAARRFLARAKTQNAVSGTRGPRIVRVGTESARRA